MKLYAARHGRTNYNDLNLCNSDPSVDVHLTDEGKLQAQSLAEKLSTATIDHIYVSELRRTQQTAEFVNAFHSVPVTVDARLNDNRTGFEDQPYDKYFIALEQAENKWTARFNDGESIEDINSRVRSFVDELRTLEYEAVLVVTSEVIIETLCGILRGLSNQEAHSLQIEQGTYLEFDFTT